jgi:hypothetical protein
MILKKHLFFLYTAPPALPKVGSILLIISIERVFNYGFFIIRPEPV